MKRLIEVLFARAIHKECFQPMLCARCVWKRSGACGIIAITLVILLASLFFTSCNNSSEPKEREPIGYAIVNGEKYDIVH